jgi:hypothetical protein
MAWWLNHLSFPWWIYVAGIVSLAAQVGALTWALREWRAKPWLSIQPTPSPRLWPILVLLTIGLGSPAAAALAFIEPGRKALVALGLGPPDPGMAYFHMEPYYPWDRYTLLSHVLPWAVFSALLTVLALTFALSAHWKVLTARARICTGQSGGDSSPFFPPSTFEVGTIICPFFACAILPLLAGVWTFERRIQKTFEMSTGMPPGEKEAFVLGGYLPATHALNVGAMSGIVGLVLAVAVAALFLKRWQKQGMAWPQGDGDLRKILPSCSLLVVLAGGVMWSATPFRVENRTPWLRIATGHSMRVWPVVPAESIERNPRASTLRFHNQLTGKLEPIRFSLLEGTDEGITPAPMLALEEDGLRVNGFRQEVTELRDELQTAVNNHYLFHPEDQRRDRLILVAEPDISGVVVAERLRIAYEVGIREVALASGRLETAARPTFGLLSRVHIMTTPTRLQSPEKKENRGESTVWLNCRDFRHFREILASAIMERRSGKEVVMVVSDK